MSTIKLCICLVISISIDAFAFNPKDFESTVGLILHKKDFKTVCSGELLSPQVVLTAAHCLTDLQKVRVINDYQISGFQYRGITGNKYIGARWVQHPAYNGTRPGSVDIGIIILNRPIEADISFHNLSIYPLDFLRPEDKLIRVGYGLRGSSNRRNIFDMTFAGSNPNYATAHDLNGMGGDSGGPVFYMTHNYLALVGVHCGRLSNMEGELLPLSYMQILDRPIWEWIHSVAGEYFSY